MHLDYNEYKKLSREIIAEGVVLLENKNKSLPLAKDEKIAVLGRSSYDTITSGTGSGGLVNIPYVVSIRDALAERFAIAEELDSSYLEWRKDHPFDKGEGWAMTPFSQVEMPLEEEALTKASELASTAILTIGRTAGEDRDNEAVKGAYYLGEEEERLVQLARKYFPKLIVFINAGNIIDLSWTKTYEVDALLYVWQGGCETGNGIVDVLDGSVNPSGKLPDSIAYEVEDYPSHANFGDGKENIYVEDIYVGYRYFETMAKEKVLYPFAYGLSYSTFSLTCEETSADDEGFHFRVRVENTGECAGKTVAQLYVKAPGEDLAKPAQELKAFKKSSCLEASEAEVLTLYVPFVELASFEDRTDSEHYSSYIVEKGEYQFFIGEHIRDLEEIFNYEQEETEVVKTLKPRLLPSEDFERLRYVDGQEQMELYKGTDCEVSENYVAPANLVEEFANWSNEELIQIAHGLGMAPSGVTAGIAGAFGGVTDGLLERGIPRIACADGPSGIRMDNGQMAFSIANGSLLAATFNEELNERLFSMLALELRKNGIEVLLGPGMNIHRHPLNGRNFEYFSEDPLLTGKIAASQIRGLATYGAVACPKHFALNNQEFARTEANVVVSPRAAREIYLKGFEIAVKEGGLRALMTSYNPINGVYAASNKDLNIHILREEWAYEGIVMTDWWAKCNRKAGEEGSREERAAMIKAGNDLYMVESSCEEIPALAKTLEAIEEGYLLRDELIRNTKAIVDFAKDVSFIHHPLELEVLNEPKMAMQEQVEIDLGKMEEEKTWDLSEYHFEKGKIYVLHLERTLAGTYEMELEISTGDEQKSLEVSQLNIAVFVNNISSETINLVGKTKGTHTVALDLWQNPNNYISFVFSETGASINECKIRLVEKRSSR